MFCDFNLRGMDYLNLKKVKFRAPIPDGFGNVSPIFVSGLPKATKTLIEVDGSSGGMKMVGGLWIEYFWKMC